MPIFCCSFIFTSPEKRKRESWGIIPENAQKHIIGYLNPREKAKFSATCKKNYELVKNVKIPVYCLQFCPLRYNSKSAEILVNFDEENQNSYSFYFDRNGLNNSLKTTIKSNGLDCVYSPRGLEAEFRLMADLCFQGWVMGSKIELLDIRGDYNGKIPSSLELSTFSFSDKYNRANSAIPAWLDIIQENDNGINFMLMSDHWDKILGHEHMNNVKDEQGFNLLVKKWIFGGFADTFEWLIVTNVTRPLKTEKLLLDIKIRGLDGSIFEEA
ncbi:Protein CBG24730, partial [Caenorhabditis briggsae]